MKAILQTAYGAPSVLQLQEVDPPRPGAGEVLIKVAAAGVNFADVGLRRPGAAFPVPVPFIPGVEGTGTIVETAPDVSDFKPGDRVAWSPVLAASAIGSYAEYQAVKVAQLLPLPDDISFEQAAGITLQGLTASYLVNDQRPIVPGITVLVHAAAGGMGQLLTQWLKHKGATVIGTTSTEAKAQIAHAAGADHVILYERDDFAQKAKELTDGRGVDYIMDGVGLHTFAKNLDAIALRGHICIFGHSSGPPEPISPLQLIPKSITLCGGYMTNYLRTREEVLAKAEEIYRGVREGWLDPHINQRLDLSQAAEAHQLFEDRSSTGKTILTVATH